MFASRARHEIQSLLTVPLSVADPKAKPVKVDLEHEIQWLPFRIRAALAKEHACRQPYWLRRRIDRGWESRNAFPVSDWFWVKEDVNAVIRRPNDHFWNDDQRRNRGYLTPLGLCNYHKRCRWSCVDDPELVWMVVSRQKPSLLSLDVATASTQ